MYFKLVANFTNFLFEGWNATTNGVFIGSCVGVFFMVLLLDAITVFKVFLHKQANLNPLTYAMTNSNIGERSPLLAPLIIPPSLQHIKKRKFYYHCAESITYIIRFILGYLIMLAVMSYNAWIGITVVIGSGVGYFFIFGFKAVYIDRIGMNKQKVVPPQRMGGGADVQQYRAIPAAET